MYSLKCKRRIKNGRCALLVRQPQGLSRTILDECSGRMLSNICPLFQEQIDAAVLADSAKAYYTTYIARKPSADA